MDSDPFSGHGGFDEHRAVLNPAQSTTPLSSMEAVVKAPLLAGEGWGEGGKNQ